MKTWLALSLLAASAHAGQHCYTHVPPPTGPNWSLPFTLPKHDPALGALQSVTVRLDSAIQITFGIESLDPQPSVALVNINGLVDARYPNGTPILSLALTVSGTHNLAAFDGTVDFDGPSGETITPMVAEDQSIVLQAPADLALFTASSPGETITLGLVALAQTGVTGPGNLAQMMSGSAGAVLSVCYGYREVCAEASAPMAPTNWAVTRTFSKHDPTIGPLRAVRLRMRARMVSAVGVENMSPLPALITSTTASLTSIRRPDTTQLLGVYLSHQFADQLAAFDGTIDFDGPSGETHSGLVEENTVDVTITSPADLALFTATAPGETIALGVRAVGDSSSTGPGAVVVMFNTSAEAEWIQLCYDYSSNVVPYCFGDGSGAPCPCGNASPAGAQQGCLNSMGVGGELRGSGFAEIGNDTLVFSASNLPANSPTLFFQGLNPVTIPFGDGLRCVNFATRRLGMASAVGGVATFPPAGSTVSDLGQAVSGMTLNYQAWYRNLVSFCTAAQFNLTNGLRISW